MSKNLSGLSLFCLQRVLSHLSLDVAVNSDVALLKLSSYLDDNPDISRHVVMQHEGMSIKGGVVWTKDNIILGLLSAKTTLSHILLGLGRDRKPEAADAVEVYMISVVLFRFKIVVSVFCKHYRC